jgi:hypothetical protein
MSQEKFDAFLVLKIVSIDMRKEWPGIGDTETLRTHIDVPSTSQ